MGLPTGLVAGGVERLQQLPLRIRRLVGGVVGEGDRGITEGGGVAHRVVGVTAEMPGLRQARAAFTRQARGGVRGVAIRGWPAQRRMAGEHGIDLRTLPLAVISQIIEAGEEMPFLPAMGDPGKLVNRVILVGDAHPVAQQQEASAPFLRYSQRVVRPKGLVRLCNWPAAS